MPYKNKQDKVRYWKNYYIENKDRKDWSGRKSHLKLKFGITPEEYDKTFEEQQGCCAICKKHSIYFKRRLAVDHDHKTGKVRGLLCMFCNTALGKFEDDVNILKNAVKYLSTQNTGV